MGSKSSKEQGNAAEIEKLTLDDDVSVELGIQNHGFMIDSLMKTIHPENVAIDIPDNIENSESRISCGSDVDIDEDILHPPEVPFNDVITHDPPESDTFDVIEYLEQRGIDARHPNMRELIESVDYREFIDLRKTMLTPKQVFQRDYGPIPGGDSVRVIRAKDNPETTSLSNSSNSIHSTDYMTDLSDDEEGWPKYDMNAILDEAQNKPDVYQNPLMPTIEDYVRDKNTSGQKVLNQYEFVEINSYLDDEPKRFECYGPDASRTQDFWTQCHEKQIGLISMFGHFHEKRGVNCARYIPQDNMETLECGKILVQRLTDPEYPYEHCKIQKFAARCILVPEEHGWYPVWHCQRTLQDDSNMDYTKHDEEFETLKMRLLDGMRQKQWLQHGPMQFSALIHPQIERNSYLFHKEESKVPEFLKQPIEAQRMRLSFYQEYRDYVHPDDDTDAVITVSTPSTSDASAVSSST